MVIMNNANTTERLIQEVRSRPPLWDQRNINYHNRVVVNTLWQDIADQLQVNKETVKVKWKGLRDTYRRELKKQRSSATLQNGGGENARDPSWTHYSSMNFLREYMGSNNNQNDLFHFQGWPADDLVANGEAVSPTASATTDTFNSFVPTAAVLEAVDTKQADGGCAAASPGNSLSGDDWSQGGGSSYHEPKTEPNERSSHDHDEAAMELSSPPSQKMRPILAKKRPALRLARLKERRFHSRLSKNMQATRSYHNLAYQNGSSSLPLPASDDSDDDLYFFKSLVPYVKSLPPTRKLYLRSEIHNLVLREMMAADTSVNSGPHQHGVIPLEHVSVGFNV